jgi:hypothetical protein
MTELSVGPELEHRRLGAASVDEGIDRTTGRSAR